jgi:hypothetical protein
MELCSDGSGAEGSEGETASESAPSEANVRVQEHTTKTNKGKIRCLNRFRRIN